MPMPGRRTKEVRAWPEEGRCAGGRGRSRCGGRQSCVTLFNFDMCLRFASYIHMYATLQYMCVCLCVVCKYVCVNCQFKFKLICQWYIAVAFHLQLSINRLPSSLIYCLFKYIYKIHIHTYTYRISMYFLRYVYSICFQYAAIFHTFSASCANFL